MKWFSLAQKVINGYECTKEDALDILNTPEEDTLSLVHGAYQIRKHYYGNNVKLNMIINAKSGRCVENCGYCSQSIYANTQIENYSLVNEETILKGARKAKEDNVGTYCIVMSGRKASPREIRAVCSAVEKIKDEMNLKVCACLGLINEEQAKELKAAGVDRFNHNINTSEAHHDQITTTHHYQDRVNTIEAVKKAHISPCSGIICGMGESKEDLIDMAFALKSLDADSIPVNFLHAIPGTKLENMDDLTPNKCLKILALFRYINPKKEIRLSGGREVNLRSLQSLGLYIANSIFVGDYLTTAGQDKTEDYKMIEDLGFHIESNAFETEAQKL
ncbi:biotin synthase BioB [Terrilactibacillus sp. BCM23-1]|uniref:Biotin synthase n=1 Tax=Terrilactibacillus tamarindi TaxID=2599694 RepID=A0A6N8CMM1_9BACI|nr:biotin synthase BioB [Terrilactibacillus tamarindi]MTT31171.1 biotin synthase BioB [Terrilactibacillus tamarindi]